MSSATGDFQKEFVGMLGTLGGEEGWAKPGDQEGFPDGELPEFFMFEGQAGLMVLDGRPISPGTCFLKGFCLHNNVPTTYQQSTHNVPIPIYIYTYIYICIYTLSTMHPYMVPGLGRHQARARPDPGPAQPGPGSGLGLAPCKDTWFLYIYMYVCMLLACCWCVVRMLLQHCCLLLERC